MTATRKPKPKPHPHPEHSGDGGDNAYFEWHTHDHAHYHTHAASQNALQVVLAALRGLHTRQDVEGVLSLVLSTLVHEDKLGLARMHGLTMNQINHYAVDIETRRH